MASIGIDFGPNDTTVCVVVEKQPDGALHLLQYFEVHSHWRFRVWLAWYRFKCWVTKRPLKVAIDG